jgi:hypothetical protein
VGLETIEGITKPHRPTTVASWSLWELVDWDAHGRVAAKLSQNNTPGTLKLHTTGCQLDITYGKSTMNWMTIALFAIVSEKIPSM